MKRRPKLNLSSDRDANKQRPAGFDSQDSNHADSAQDVPENESLRLDSREFAETAKENHPTLPGWPSAKQIAKVLIVVAATALSLYLVKRRFF